MTEYGKGGLTGGGGGGGPVQEVGFELGPECGLSETDRSSEGQWGATGWEDTFRWSVAASSQYRTTFALFLAGV